MAWIRNRKQQLSEKTDYGVDPIGNNHGGNGREQIDAIATADAADDDVVVDDAQSATQDWFHSLKRELHQQVIGKMDLSAMGTMGEDDLRLEVRRQAESLCRRRADLLSLDERERLVNEVLDETFGLGPLEILMRDPEISDILINGPKTVYIEKRGRLLRSKVAFHDANHVLQIVQRIVAGMGRRVDETCPMVDPRLPDGSRLNAIIHPLALDGPLVSIRRFGAKPLLVKDLLANNSITEEMLKFLSACVEARINILISGGTGSSISKPDWTTSGRPKGSSKPPAFVRSCSASWKPAEWRCRWRCLNGRSWGFNAGGLPGPGIGDGQNPHLD